MQLSDFFDYMKGWLPVSVSSVENHCLDFALVWNFDKLEDMQIVFFGPSRINDILCTDASGILPVKELSMMLFTLFEC